MKLSIKEQKEVYTISIEGDLDASSSISLDKAIAEFLNGEKASTLLMECSSLNYISSAGLGVFIAYLQEFESKKIRLIFLGLNDKVKNIFQIVGLDQLVKIVNSEEEVQDILP